MRSSLKRAFPSLLYRTIDWVHFDVSHTQKTRSDWATERGARIVQTISDVDWGAIHIEGIDAYHNVPEHKKVREITS